MKKSVSSAKRYGFKMALICHLSQGISGQVLAKVAFYYRHDNYTQVELQRLLHLSATEDFASLHTSRNVAFKLFK